MALVKTVEMRVLADAGDAQKKLDELDAKAKDLDGNDIKMRFRLEDGNAKAQMDEIRAKADALGYKDVSIKVKVDGAGRAIADLAAVKHEEDKVRDTGILNRIGGMLSIGNLGGMAGGALGAKVPFFGSVQTLGLLAPALGAVATELLGVASGFAAAAAGAGAFALLAMPAVKKVETALKDIQKGKSLASLHLTVDEKDAISGIEKLKTTFGKISTAFQPQAFKVFADGLRVINNLLPHVTQFATPFAGALDGLLQKLAKFTASKGFADWLKQFSTLVGPAVTSIGEGIGKVANAFGKLMTTMSGKDVAHAINIAFGGIAGTISVVASAIHRFMQNWDSMSSAARRGARDVASSFDSIRCGAGSPADDVASEFAQAGHVIASWVSAAGHYVTEVVSVFRSLPGRILGALGNLGGLLFNAGRAIVGGLIRGIESMAGAVGSAIGSLVGKIRSFLPFSPAKVGPLSGSGSPDIAGAKIAAMLAGGMNAGAPGVGRAAGRLAGAAAVTPATAGYGYGGDGGMHVHFHSLVASPQDARKMVQVLREYKRTGGNAALGIA